MIRLGVIILILLLWACRMVAGVESTLNLRYTYMSDVLSGSVSLLRKWFTPPTDRCTSYQIESVELGDRFKIPNEVGLPRHKWFIRYNPLSVIISSIFLEVAVYRRSTPPAIIYTYSRR